MMQHGGPDRSKEQYWRGILRQWRRSGLSGRSFCRVHGLSEPSFYAWRRTSQQRDQQASPESQGAARRATTPVQRTAALPCRRDGLPNFVPVTIAAPTPSLELVLGDGRSVRVPAGFDAATLRQLLAVLQETPPC
jgi:hypothetical protein